MWPLWAVSTRSRAACLPALRPDPTQLRQMLLLSGAGRSVPSDGERLRRLRRNRLRAINFSWRGRCRRRRRRSRWRQLSWQNDQQNATFFSGNCCQQQQQQHFPIFLHVPPFSSFPLSLFFLGVFNLPPWLITDRQSRPCFVFYCEQGCQAHCRDCNIIFVIVHNLVIFCRGRKFATLGEKNDVELHMLRVVQVHFSFLLYFFGGCVCFWEHVVHVVSFVVCFFFFCSMWVVMIALFVCLV